MTYGGKTTVYAELQRIDGLTLHLMTHDGTPLRCVAPAEVVAELRPRIGEEIGLDGIATWRAGSVGMIAFTPESVNPYRDRDPGMDRPRTITEAFARLAEACGDRWDGVDPDEFVRELRAD